MSVFQVNIKHSLREGGVGGWDGGIGKYAHGLSTSLVYAFENDNV